MDGIPCTHGSNEKVKRFEEERKDNSHLIVGVYNFDRLDFANLVGGWLVGLFLADDGSFCAFGALLKE